MHDRNTTNPALGSLMARIHYGVHQELEAAADELIRQSLVNVTKYSEKADILTPWKMKNRLEREVYTESGVPDASVRQGMFGRRHNPARPDLNSRDGIARGGRKTEALRKFAEEQHGHHVEPSGE